ncbi:MAG TPA: PDZ domain-containing protein [Longimicrobiaceae bacterium]|jgi:hypothetical protein|nr:PDZ domain-containing protein [Longimicrobiaceae bacterium]
MTHAPRALALLALLAAAPAAGQRVSLRPASVGLAVEDAHGTLRVAAVAPRGPAALAGIVVGQRLVAAGGRPLAGAAPAVADSLLLGEPGSTVDVQLAQGGGTRALRLRRAEVFAPSMAPTAVIAGRYLVVHYPAGDAALERYARRLASEGEAFAAADLRGADTGGRRMHLYAAGPETRLTVADRARRGMVPWWGQWLPIAAVPPEERFGRSLAYLRFGAPGAAARARLEDRYGWSYKPGLLHRRALRTLATGEMQPGTAIALGANLGTGASLRTYVRDRFGDARFGVLWRSDEPFDAAVPHALGISERDLLAAWEASLYASGPDPKAGPDGGDVLAGIAWGIVALLAGVLVARRREVA